MVQAVPASPAGGRVGFRGRLRAGEELLELIEKPHGASSLLRALYHTMSGVNISSPGGICRAFTFYKDRVGSSIKLEFGQGWVDLSLFCLYTLGSKRLDESLPGGRHHAAPCVVDDDNLLGVEELSGQHGRSDCVICNHASRVS